MWHTFANDAIHEMTPDVYEIFIKKDQGIPPSLSNNIGLQHVYRTWFWYRQHAAIHIDINNRNN